MPKFLLAFSALLALLLASVTPGVAQERSWRIGKWSGQVTLHTAAGVDVVNLDGATVSPGDRITTGPGSRVMMMRGADTVVMSENSVLEIPASEKEGVTPTVLQSAGTVSFDVEPRAVQHFIVETPHLAAVVKGTQFVVKSEGRTSRVDVSRGVVEVADMRSGQYASIEANRYASSSDGSTPGLLIGGEGSLPMIRQASPRKPLLQSAASEAPPPPAPARLATPPAIKLEAPAPQGVLQTITMRAKAMSTSIGLPARFADAITEALVFAVLFMGSCGFLASTLYAARNRRPEHRRNSGQERD
jgi:hypothetical protein